nr:HAD family hydrolase [Pyrobaculum sp.]
MATILIDLDGTLLPLKAWNPVFAEISAAIAERAGAPPEEVWRRVREMNLALMRRLDWRAFDWQFLFAAAAAELGVREVPDVVEVLRKHLPSFRLHDGALEALAELRAMGCRVEIATNGHAQYQLPVIRQLGLDRVVDGVRTSDAYRCPKTCPEFFHGAQVMVGDNPVFDVYFPKRYGLRAVFLGDWGREAPEYSRRLQIPAYLTPPDEVVGALGEVPEAVKRVLGKRLNF